MKDFNEKYKRAIRGIFNNSRQGYTSFEKQYGFFSNLTNTLVSAIGYSTADKESVKDVLDIGCGIGNSTNKLANIFPGSNVIGLDFSEGMIEQAKKSYPKIIFVCADGEKADLHFAHDQFDLVVYPASLFIIPDQEASIIAAAKVLKKKGSIAASILKGLREKNGQPMDNLPEYKGIMKNEELPQLFEQHFETVKTSTILIDMNRQMLQAIYRIEALAAGAFKAPNQVERMLMLQDLLKEADSKNSTLVQEWQFIVGRNKLDVYSSIDMV